MSEQVKYRVGPLSQYLDEYSGDTQAYFNSIGKIFPKEENENSDCHGKLVDHFMTSKSDRIGVCASRGLGKSRHIGNYLPITIPLLGLGLGTRKDHKFIIIISATFDNAVDMIQEVKDLYESMDTRFKNLIKKDIWKADEISFTLADGKTLSIVAMGAEGKIRGIRRKGHRPDLLIFDDSEYEELVLNPERMKKWKRWVTRSAIPAMTPDGAVAWVGTPLPNSMLGELQENEDWDFIELPIEDDFGTPAWIDRFPHSWITGKKEEFRKMGEINAWFQEYELKIISEDEQIFRPEMFRYKNPDEVPDDLDVYITCDLAISSASSADRTAFVVTGVDVYNKLYVLEIFAKRCPPSVQVNELIRLCEKYYERNHNRQVIVGMEKGALKHSFDDQWNRRLLEIGHLHKIPTIKELNPYGSSIKDRGKNRIQQLEPLFNRGNYVFTRNIENLKEMENEFLAFPVSKHDDISDAASYVLQLISWREELPSEPVNRMQTKYTGVSW